MAFGLGSRLPDQDAEATARGNAFTATADNPSAIFYNPAGIMQLGDGLDHAAAAFTAFRSMRGTSRSPVRRGAHDSTAHEPFQPVPAVLRRLSPQGPGLLLRPRYLLAVWLEDRVAGRRLIPPGRRLRQPRVHRRSTRSSPCRSPARSRSASAFPPITSTRSCARALRSMPGDSFSFKGDGLSVGGNAGILWKPTERQSIGFSYHSPVEWRPYRPHPGGAQRLRARRHPRPGTRRLPRARDARAGIAQINSLPLPPSREGRAHRPGNRPVPGRTRGCRRPGQRLIPHQFPDACRRRAP